MKKKYGLLAMVLVFLLMAYVPVGACDSTKDTGCDATATATATGGSATIDKGAVVNTNTATGGAGGSVGPITNTNVAIGGAGGAGGTGGAGGSATIQKGAVQNDNTVNVGNGIGNFSPSSKVDNKIDNTNVNVVDPTIKNKNTNVGINTNRIDNQNTQSQSNSNTFNPTNNNSNSQDQSQVQTQGQNNNQRIDPKQTVTFVSPKPLLQAPMGNPGELEFGHGAMSDVTSKMPKFALGITALSKDDRISDVLSITANEKFKNLYKVVLEHGKRVLEGHRDITINHIRYQIVEAESQKSWTTGGSLNGSGAGYSGATALGGSAGLFPQVGRTKADFLYTIIFVKVE